MARAHIQMMTAAAALLFLAVPAAAQDGDRRAYFGELHIHSGNSFDAANGGTLIDPRQAYRFARGEAVEYRGRMVQRKAALDFLAVTDHSEYMGVFRMARGPNAGLVAEEWREILANPTPENAQRRREIMQSGFYDNPPVEALISPAIKQEVWQEVIQNADDFYEPGEFTTFAAYEWSPTPNGGHHHRNVIFRGPDYPDAPFSSIDSPDPELLWAYADRNRQAGIDSVLIPHNPNLSGGITFSYTRLNGEPMDADYAEIRARNERLVEVTQVKGTSETHPELSPGDPFADFELLEHYRGPVRGPLGGAYARDAYGRGLEIADRIGVNPFTFGLVGASDYHTAMSGTEEDNFTGALGQDDVTDPQRLFNTFVGLWNQPLVKIGASGITGVWADENTREAIFDALKRREAFATSGPQIQVRLFAGWDYADDILEHEDWPARAYQGGVPMGGDLAAGGDASPVFIVEAAKDPRGANLDRIQIVKVWLQDGAHREQVFDVVWSGERQPAADGLVPAVGSTVDVAAATYTNDIGSATLHARWTDPGFDPAQAAVYYARAIEIPTPRWSTYLAVEHGLETPDVVPETLQERAWTSPIFYHPG